MQARPSGSGPVKGFSTTRRGVDQNSDGVLVVVSDECMSIARGKNIMLFNCHIGLINAYIESNKVMDSKGM